LRINRELIRAYAELTARFPDEIFSSNFILASGRTRKLQVGLLAAIVTITLALVTLELIRIEAPRGSVALTSHGRPLTGEDVRRTGGEWQ
jgi:hypothetical protein